MDRTTILWMLAQVTVVVIHLKYRPKPETYLIGDVRNLNLEIC